MFSLSYPTNNTFSFEYKAAPAGKQEVEFQSKIKRQPCYGTGMGRQFRFFYTSSGLHHLFAPLVEQDCWTIKMLKGGYS